jgi:UDPglucose 6-dehydrogenase
VIGDHLNEVKIIANKSTVPVGTARHVADIIRTRTEQPFHIASNPEFLKQGAAVSDFMRPDRVIIGVDSSEAQDIMAELYAPFVMSGNPILFMDIASAELAKYAANAMLAMRISFMNQMADLCERVGANVMDVRRGIASDNRIGSAFLYPGPGYGGSCLPKDVKALLHTSRSLGLEADLFSAIERVNERQKTVLLRKVLHRLGRNLEGVALGVWGLAFKAGTDDMRDSPAIPLIQGLLEAGAIVRAHDPKASDAARSVFGDSITYVADPYEAARDASAVIVLTEWLQYRTPDFERLRDLMHRPLFIDGRNLYEGERMDRHGFEYESIGRPPLVRVEAGREP